MALIQLACLILATTCVKTSKGQCYGRNAHHSSGSSANNGVTRAYLPVVLADQYPLRDSSSRPICTTVPDQSTHTVLTNEDLKALLQLAKVLESDKTACATKGIDVDRLLETLVTALVYTTTHTVETSANRCNTAAEIDVSGLLGQNGLVERLLSIILGGQSTSVTGGVVRSVTQGIVTSETKSGQGLVDIGLGQDGLKVKVDDLVSANVGGKESATGTTETTSYSTTSTVGGLLGDGGHGLVDIGLGQDGLKVKVDDLVSANVGGKESATGTTETTSYSTTSTVGGLLGDGGHGLVDIGLGQDGLKVKVDDLVSANVGGKESATGTTETTSYSTTSTVGGLLGDGGQGLLDIGLGQDGLKVKVDDLVSANVGGKKSAAGTTGTTYSSTTSTVGGLLANGGRGLVDIGLGQDGLKVKVDDLVSANVGGKESAAGTTETTLYSTTSTVGGLLGNGGTQTGNNGDKGLLGDVTGNDGVVGGVI